MTRYNFQEKTLSKIVISYLKKGRAGWDLPHTLACVHWIKELLKNENGNPKILVPVMYFHDIGYIELMEGKENLNLERNMNMKEEHMRRGAILAREILENRIEGFTKEEIERICYLVSIHDNYEIIKEINDNDAQLVYEADGLGQIDRDRVKPTYSKEDAEIFLRDFQKKRGQRFRTESGKIFYRELFERALKYASDN